MRLGIEVELGLGWIVVRFEMARLGLGLGLGLEFDFGLVWVRFSRAGLEILVSQVRCRPNSGKLG